MKRIDLNIYDKSMGILIDVSSPETYLQKMVPGSVNIPYQKLLLNYKTLLDKKKILYYVF